MLLNRWWDGLEALIQSGDLTIAYRASHKALLRVFANTPHNQRVPGRDDSKPKYYNIFHRNPQQWYVSLI